ncbi:MAG TPA: PIN domain-containing protein [Longimicrobium sp.]|nr:PIN domain-containing protein [Longimicrobium sp.]
MAKPELLIDTSFAVALVTKADQYHDTAKRLSDYIRRRFRLVVTQAVCLEIGNALADARNRATGVRLLSELRSDKGVVDEAFSLFSKRPDKEWSLIDCVSFVVMNERGSRRRSRLTATSSKLASNR